MSFVPCVIEGGALTFLFKFIFNFSWSVSGLTAFMLAAVSPAVIVPSMLDLKNKGHSEVPTIVMAGASIDDVFAITLFSVFLGLSKNSEVNILKSALSVPFSIVIGVVSGIVLGFLLSIYFKKRYTAVRATEKALVLLVGGTLLVQVGEIFHFAALLGIMTVGFILLERHEEVARELSLKFSKIWIFAEIILFVLIGFSLDIKIALQAGLKGLLVISLGLIFRSLGVFIATAFSKLNFKERLFCVIAYLPKATVQAALGGVALSYGLAEGNVILAIAVVAILFTAPLGLFGIKIFAPLLLGNPHIASDNVKI
ncbi:MAG TPA: cation:proton antiporter, partial [Spirochaetota bacterium]|nr:cation:proton antiporter [Spirochaetota bacterium]